MAQQRTKHCRKFRYGLDTGARNLGRFKIAVQVYGVSLVRPLQRTEHSGIARDETQATVQAVALEQNVAWVGSPRVSADESYSAV